jgi:hypothetical protein
MTDRTHASALSEEELMSVAYDDDILSADQRTHLEQCTICQQQLAMYTTTNALLSSKLYRTLCPSAVNLNYYCLGVVSEEERIQIANHLLDCPSCADEVAEIRRTQASVELYPPGAWSPIAALRRIFATLVVQQAQPVTRAMTPGKGWPRQYRAESLDLSLHLSRASNGEILLLGIITSADANESVDAFEGQKVDLYLAPGPLATEGENADAILPGFTTEVDDVGNIVLEDIQPGNYVMILHLPDREVIVEGLNIDQT